MPNLPTKNDWAILARHGITPDKLSVGGVLYLIHTFITALPDNLKVGGSLYLSGAGITALPDNLSVGGSLYLRSAGITALPDNLKVGGSLYLSGAGITALPDNLKVGGSLDLWHTGITALYRDERGHRLDRAGDSYIAGCRNFTADEAFAHWGSENYPDKARGAAFCAAVRAEEAKRKGKRK